VRLTRLPDVVSKVALRLTPRYGRSPDRATNPTTGLPLRPRRSPPPKRRRRSRDWAPPPPKKVSGPAFTGPLEMQQIW